jgi:PAS domain S-box-containing protein
MSKRFVNPALFALLCLVLLIWQLTAPACAQPKPRVALAEKNVLILHTFQSNLPGNVKTDQGITLSLHSGGVDVKNQFFEFLDFPRNPSPEHRKVLAELMRSRYSQHRIDLIITQYPDALQFLLNEGRTVFPEAPILAMYMHPRIELPKTGRLIIQHSATFDMIGTLESALKLFPRAKRVYVVGGVSSVDRTLENQVRQDFKKWEGQLDFRYLSDMSLEDMLSVVSSAPPGTIVLFTALTADITGKTYIPRDVVQRLSQVSTAPVFGLYDTLLGYGIVGGFLVGFEHIGTKAGELALNILTTGSSPDKTSAILDVPPVPMFDWRQLRHWNLSVDALPKGSIVINREFTLWDFRYYIFGALAFCLLETALIIFLIVQRRRKKVAEDSLRYRTQDLDQFFNVTLDLLCIANTDGYFLRLNPAWERILGYTREELMARRFFDFLHPDDLNRTGEVVSTLASQQKVFSFENRYCCKDGTYRWLEWTSAPAGKLIYAAARDVTERKRAEAEIARARAELLRVERSTRLSELTASLAHELNQPLAAILSNAQAALRFLKSDKPDLNEFQEILRDIISDDQRAGNVIRSLRSMMNREEGEKRPTVLNDILKDVIQIFHSEAIFRSVSIETELDGSLPPVFGDKGQLQQVGLNIIMNGAEAMSRNPPEQRKLILRTQRKDHSIWVTVRDFGPGIDEENLERMFQPFFTTKGTGLGMGLAVCSSIIKDHRGRIWAENNPDGGATFFIELPVISDQ